MRRARGHDHRLRARRSRRRRRAARRARRPGRARRRARDACSTTRGRRAPARRGPAARRAVHLGALASTRTSTRTERAAAIAGATAREGTRSPAASGFVGRTCRALRGRGRRRRVRRPLRRRHLDITDREAVAGRRSPRTDPRSCTTSPRSSHVGDVVGRPDRRAARQRRRHRATCSTRRAPSACGRVARDRQRRGVRRRSTNAICRSARTRRCARHALRREQGRGVVPRAAGVPRVRARRRARARVLPHRARASRTASSCPRSRSASRPPSASERDEIRVGSLDPVRELSDVRDVVRAYRLLAERGEAGEVYNVCSGAGVSVARDRRAPRRGGAAARCASPSTPTLVRPVDVPRLVGDSAELGARDRLGARVTASTRPLADVLERRRAPISAAAASDALRPSGGRASRAAPRSRGDRGAGGADRSRRSAARRAGPPRRRAGARRRPARRRRRCRARAATAAARRGAPRRPDRGCAIARIHASGSAG